MSLGGLDTILQGILNIVGPLFVTPAALFIAKKLHDDQVRKAIATAADAGLILVLAKTKPGALSSIAQLVQQVAQLLLDDKKVATSDLDMATKAAAAAIARSGLAAVQTVHVNPDGTVTPTTKVGN